MPNFSHSGHAIQTLEQWDAVALFASRRVSNGMFGSAVVRMIEDLYESPLWSTLNAARKDIVYKLDAVVHDRANEFPRS